MKSCWRAPLLRPSTVDRRKISAVPSSLARQRPLLAILGILALAAALRFWTIGAGLPFEIGVDEPVIMDKSVQMIRTGDFNPHFFDYPGLTYYLQAAVASARFLAGAAEREWTSLRDVWTGDFYLWARAATALFGVATVFLTYRAGLRWGLPAALIAALAMAVQPQHVRESHFALTDVPMTFFIVLSIVQSLSAAQSRRTLEFFFAGIAVGLATATKYNGALALLMPLSAVAAVRGIRPVFHATTAAAAGAAAGFLAGAPYTILDLPGFLNGFARLMQYYNADTTTADGAATYLRYIVQWFGWPPTLWTAIAIPALAVCATGAVQLAAQIRHPSTRPMALILLVFPVMYFWFVAGQSLRFGRYALPLAPFLCLWFGIGATWLVERAAAWPALAPVARSKAIATAALLMLLAPPLGAAITANLSRREISPTAEAAAWLLANVKREEAVAIEGRAFLQLPPSRVRVHPVNRVLDKSLEEFQREGVVYLVASSSEYDTFLKDPSRHPAIAQGYASLFSNTQTVQVFPTRDPNRWPTIRIQRIVP